MQENNTIRDSVIQEISSRPLPEARLAQAASILRGEFLGTIGDIPEFGKVNDIPSTNGFRSKNVVLGRELYVLRLNDISGSVELDEYRAGLDPQNRQSYELRSSLRIEAGEKPGIGAGPEANTEEALSQTKNILDKLKRHRSKDPDKLRKEMPGRIKFLQERLKALYPKLDLTGSKKLPQIAMEDDGLIRIVKYSDGSLAVFDKYLKNGQTFGETSIRLSADGDIVFSDETYGLFTTPLKNSYEAIRQTDDFIVQRL